MTHSRISRVAIAFVTLQLVGCSLLGKVTTKTPTGAPKAPEEVTSPTEAAPITSATPAGDPTPAVEKENIKGLPPKVVELVRESYPADPNRPGTETNTRNNYYDSLRSAGASFDAAWSAYEQRAAIVKPAIAKAVELEKAGKLAEARRALEEVITPTVVDANGKIDPRGRKTLDPRDAELPAIEAWVRMCVALEDYKSVVEAGRHYVQRRKARDKETELWFWIAAANDKELGFLVSQSGTGIRHEVWKIYDEAAKVRGAPPFDTEGQRTAGMYFNSLSQFGLPWTTVDVEKGKAGAWVMIRVEPVEIGARQIKHSSTQQWRVPKSCRDSAKVSWWDGNGNPVYEQVCDYNYYSRPITLSAKLVETAPAWTTGREMLLVVGKITAAGPAWKLTDAFVPDLRFAETGFLF
jgi:hypothetical protein